MLLVFADIWLGISCSLRSGVWHAATCEVSYYLGAYGPWWNCTSIRLGFISTIIIVRLKVGTYVQSQLVMHVIRSVVVLTCIWVITCSCYCCCDLATFLTVDISARNDWDLDVMATIAIFMDSLGVDVSRSWIIACSFFWWMLVNWALRTAIMHLTF